MRIANANEARAIIGTDARTAARAPNRHYCVPFNWSSVAAGVNLQSSVKNDAGSAFVVDGIVGSAWLTATVGTSIAYTPLHNWSDASPPATVGNTFQSRTGLRVFFQTNDAAWMQSPTRWTNYVGTVESPYIPVFNHVIAPGANMVWTLYNDLTITVGAEILLVGHYIGV